jgi:MFS family permease
MQYQYSRQKKAKSTLDSFPSQGTAALARLSRSNSTSQLTSFLVLRPRSLYVSSYSSLLKVANLYYNQPILIHLSTAFGVPYDTVSNIPALTQAGYAASLLLISPLGDLVKRRPLVLLLCIAGALVSIGLATTNSLAVFEALSFIVGIVSVAGTFSRAKIGYPTNSAAVNSGPSSTRETCPMHINRL